MQPAAWRNVGAAALRLAMAENIISKAWRPAGVMSKLVGCGGGLGGEISKWRRSSQYRPAGQLSAAEMFGTKAAAAENIHRQLKA